MTDGSDRLQAADGAALQPQVDGSKDGTPPAPAAAPAGEQAALGGSDGTAVPAGEEGEGRGVLDELWEECDLELEKTAAEEEEREKREAAERRGKPEPEFSILRGVDSVGSSVLLGILEATGKAIAELVPKP